MERKTDSPENVVDLGVASEATQGPPGPTLELGVINDILMLRAE